MNFREILKKCAAACGLTLAFTLLWVATIVAVSLCYGVATSEWATLVVMAFSGAGVLLVTPLLWRFAERRPVRELFAAGASPWRAFLVWGLAGVGLMAATIVLLMGLDGASIVGLSARPDLGITFVAACLPMAFFEEVGFRGFLLGVWRRAAGTHTAVAVTALVFALFHCGNDGMTSVAFVNVFLAGVLLAILRIRAGLAAATAFHFGWNAAQSVAGFSVSGTGNPCLLLMEPSGQWWLNGGDFGVEGSVCAFITLGLAAAWISLRTRHDCALIPTDET